MTVADFDKLAADAVAFLWGPDALAAELAAKQAFVPSPGVMQSLQGGGSPADGMGAGQPPPGQPGADPSQAAGVPPAPAGPAAAPDAAAGPAAPGIAPPDGGGADAGMPLTLDGVRSVIQMELQKLQTQPGAGGGKGGAGKPDKDAVIGNLATDVYNLTRNLHKLMSAMGTEPEHVNPNRDPVTGLPVQQSGPVSQPQGSQPPQPQAVAVPQQPPTGVGAAPAAPQPQKTAADDFTLPWADPFAALADGLGRPKAASPLDPGEMLAAVLDRAELREVLAPVKAAADAVEPAEVGRAVATQPPSDPGAAMAATLSRLLG